MPTYQLDLKTLSTNYAPKSPAHRAFCSKTNPKKTNKTEKKRWRLVRCLKLLPEKWVAFPGWKCGGMRIMLANLVDAST
jgi:hypothetical protein